MLCFLYQNIFSSTTMNWNSNTYLDASISRKIIAVSLSPYIQSTYLPRSSYVLLVCMFRFFQVFSKGIIDLTRTRIHQKSVFFQIKYNSCLHLHWFSHFFRFDKFVLFGSFPIRSVFNMISYPFLWISEIFVLFDFVSFHLTSVFMVMVMECGQIW